MRIENTIVLVTGGARGLGEHLSRVAEAAGHSANVASLTARLDRLQHGPARPSNGASAPGQAVGR